MKSDKLIVFVFALVGLAFGVGFLLLTMDGPDNSFFQITASHTAGRNDAQLHVLIMGSHVYSRPISNFDEFAYYHDFATYSLRGVIVLACSFLGLALGYGVSRVVSRARAAPRRLRVAANR